MCVCVCVCVCVCERERERERISKGIYIYRGRDRREGIGKEMVLKGLKVERIKMRHRTEGLKRRRHRI